MQLTVYNPQKGPLETIAAEFTQDNTTWFSNCRNTHDVSMITDIDGNILIREFDYSYPFMIYGVSQALENEFSGAFSDIVFAITDWSPERKFLGPFLVSRQLSSVGYKRRSFILASSAVNLPVNLCRDAARI